MIDPIVEFSHIREDVPTPDAARTLMARARLLGEIAEVERQAHGRPARVAAGRWILNRPIALAATAALGAVAAVLAIAIPGDDRDGVAIASNVGSVAAAAAKQPPPRTLGPGQYVYWESTTVTKVTSEYTQSAVDRFRREALSAVRQRKGIVTYLPGSSEADTQRRQRERDLLIREREQMLLRRFHIRDLPTSTVAYTVQSKFVNWIDQRHRVSGPDASHLQPFKYATPDQAKSARILAEQGVPMSTNGVHGLEDRIVDGKDLESFTWNSRELAKLPRTPGKLAAALDRQPLPKLGNRARRPLRNDRERFHAIVGILRSPFAPPKLRSAAVLVIADLAGVTAQSNAVDARGRAGLGLSIREKSVREQVVIDGDDSRVLGINYVLDGPPRIASSEGFAVLKRAAVRTTFGPSIVIQGEPVCRFKLPHGLSATNFCRSKIRPVTG
ncbi:MAG TPA: hypothetical protein VGO97_00820 [Solirubrobacterales bacterium]|jgi:hypothetical protein|nr:hypothetical protein [Solirubrobacterales bacterium]